MAWIISLLGDATFPALVLTPALSPQREGLSELLSSPLGSGVMAVLGEGRWKGVLFAPQLFLPPPLPISSSASSPLGSIG